MEYLNLKLERSSPEEGMFMTLAHTPQVVCIISILGKTCHLASFGPSVLEPVSNLGEHHKVIKPYWLGC